LGKVLTAIVLKGTSGVQPGALLTGFRGFNQAHYQLDSDALDLLNLFRFVVRRQYETCKTLCAEQEHTFLLILDFITNVIGLLLFSNIQTLKFSIGCWQVLQKNHVK